MNGFVSAEDCLFDAFANEDMCNPQDYKQFWAIYECFRRSDSLQREFNSRKARKEHECIRGCKIKPGHEYFARAEFYASVKIFAGCMAMILYYGGYCSRKPTFYDHWDIEKKIPVLLSKESTFHDIDE